MHERDRGGRGHGEDLSPWAIGSAHYDQRDLYTTSASTDDDGYARGPSYHPEEGSYAYPREFHPGTIVLREGNANLYEREAWPWLNYSADDPCFAHLRREHDAPAVEVIEIRPDEPDDPAVEVIHLRRDDAEMAVDMEMAMETVEDPRPDPALSVEERASSWLKAAASLRRRLRSSTLRARGAFARIASALRAWWPARRFIGPSETVPASSRHAGGDRTDSQLLYDVERALLRVDELDARTISVDVVRAEATLEGTVPDRRARRTATRTAEAVPGVVAVHNHLVVVRADDDGVGGDADAALVNPYVWGG